MENRTIRALAEITDEGQFEKIAAAVLRITVPTYNALAHPGINAEGKTCKSPLDGVCFAPDDPMHLIAAHHTITAASALERKWLHDPSAIKPRKGGKSPPVPAGDLIKTIEIVREERNRQSDLRATLILTTNKEPGETLLRKTVAAGRAHGINVDIWSRSRIAHVLDLNPSGQLVRRNLLGIEEELLSREILCTLAKTSIAAFCAGDDPQARVGRALDDQLSAIIRPVTFLVAESGTGKTVACQKALEAHVAAGGAALVLPHILIEQAVTLEHAVMAALRQLKPSLTSDQSPFALASEKDPLLIVIEDVNRSSQPQRLVEKVAGWDARGEETQSPMRPWHLICPVWPHLLGGLASQLKDRIQTMVLRPEPMSLTESAAAVTARASRAGASVTDDNARRIAAALGHDPLLIALTRDWSDPAPDRTIERFVEDAFSRVHIATRALAADLRQALLALCAEMLARRALDPSWTEIMSWKLPPDTIASIKQIAQLAELLRIEGPSSDMRLRFRHDRVRNWLLAAAAAALNRGDRLPDTIVSEPLLAEIVAAVIVRDVASDTLMERVEAQNPLTLFHAIRLSAGCGPSVERLSARAKSWLAKPENKGRATAELRWQALAAIEEVEGNFMLDIVGEFPNWPTGMLARMRNGDLEGGIAMCASFELYRAVHWLQRPIASARHRFGAALTSKLAHLLDQNDPDSACCEALLRFAGIWGDPALAETIRRLWERDTDRDDHLGEYLWAFARCATQETAANLLAPVCAAWGALPEDRDGNKPSPRDDLATTAIRWAFERAVPVHALTYLISRAAQPDLAWQIQYLLHGVDHPEAVAFQVQCMAECRSRSGGSYVLNNQAREHWRRAQELHGGSMSPASREPLLALWRDPAKDEHLRVAAFDLWSAGSQSGDLAILQGAAADDLLTDRILARRLERGDQAAIPNLIAKLDADETTRWWHYAGFVWSSALDLALGPVEI